MPPPKDKLDMKDNYYKLLKRAIFALILIASIPRFTQAQNFFISGGHAFSTALCEDGKVFAWGSNADGQLGDGTIGGIATTPQLVVSATMPDIQAVDAGSGAHVVALGCDNTVWTWGENCNGQLGNGTGGGENSPTNGSCPSSSASPVQVLTGEQGDPSGFLQDVTYVTSGTSQSYAILDNGTLMAWGANDKGQLADQGASGSFSNTPVFVRKSDGSLLTDVVAVDASDYASFALTADGKVWAWGENANQVLGCDGCAGDQTSAIAVQVDNDGDLNADGQISNIVSITAGDAHGLFLDEDGFLWSVGGDWGPGQRGNTDIYDNQDFARKVASGEAIDSLNDNYLAGIQAISASQAASAAVVELNGYGYLMTWGGNQHFSQPAAGGVLGIGNTNTSHSEELPVFVEEFYDPSTNTTTTYENVVGVSDGDGVFYVITLNASTNEREVWVTGSNNNGQLGLGDQDDRYIPTKLVIPSCKIADPCPIADLGADTSVQCPGFQDELYAGSQANTYRYTWEYDGNDVTNDTSTTKGGAYLETQDFGTYIVTIEDIRSVNTCNGCPTVKDTIVFEPAEAPLDTLYTPYCGTNGQFMVENAVGDFEWYDAETAGNQLTGAVVSGTDITLDIDRALTDEIIADSIYSVWVEDVTVFPGNIGKPTSSGSTQNVNEGKAYQRFVVYKDVKITSVDLRVQSYSGNLTVNFTPVLYGTTLFNNKEVPDWTNVISTGASGSATFDATLQTVTVPLDIQLTGSSRGNIVWLQLIPDVNNFQWKYDQTTGAPYVDDIDGNTLELVGFAKDGNNPSQLANNTDGEYGPFFNIGLEKPTDYTCGRIEVSVFKQCPPCNKPLSVTINETGPIDLCVGDNQTLSGTYDDNGVVANNVSYYYSWHFGPGDGSRSTSIPDVVANYADFDITSATSVDSGYFYYRVEDGDAGDEACYTEDSILVAVNRIPSLSTTDPAAACSPDVVDITGTWVDANNSNATITYHTGSPATTANEIADATSISATGTYYVHADNNGCTDTEPVDVTINTTPGITVTDPAAVCEPTTIDITTVWVDDSSTVSPNVFYFSGTPSVGTLITSTQAAAVTTTGTYYVALEVDGCGDTASINVQIDTLPTPIIGTDLTNICEGTSRTFTNTTHSANSTYVWTVSGTGVSDDGSTTEDISVTAGTGDITISVVETNENGCSNTVAVTETISVDQLPSAADAGTDIDVCIADAINMQAANPSVGTGVWTYASSSTTTGVIDDLSDNVSSVTGLTGTDILVGVWTVSNGTCPSDDDTVTITATAIAAPTVSISASDDLVCEGTNITLTASGNNGGTLNEFEFFDNINGNSIQTASTTTTFDFVATQDTVIEVEFSSNSSCLGTNPDKVRESVSITVVPLPDAANITQTDFQTCSATETLTAAAISASSTGTWSIRAGDNGSISSTGDVSSLVPGSTTRAYYTVSTGTECPDEIDSVDINVLPIVTTPVAGGDQTICETETEPLLSGNTPSNTGETGTWDVVSPGSATISAAGQTGNLQVGENIFEYSITNTLCTLRDTVSIFVDAEPTDVSITTNSVVTCDDIVVLDALTPSPTTAVGTWGNINAATGTPFIATADINNPTATINDLETGITTLEWKVINGVCVDVPAVTMTIEKKGTPTAPIITLDGGNYSSQDVSNGVADLCESDAYTITGATPNATSGETGIWSIESGTGVTVTEDGTTSQTLNIVGTNVTVLRWTIDPNVTGCNPIFRDVTLTPYTAPDAAASSTGLAICGETGSLNATPVTTPTVGTWTVVSGTISGVDGSNDPAQAFTGLQGDVTLNWTTSTGGECPDDVAVVTLTGEEAITPVVTLVQDPSTGCADSTITFTATPVTTSAIGNITYYFNVGGALAQNPSPSNTFEVNGLDVFGQDVEVVMDDDGCTSTPTAAATIDADIAFANIILLDEEEDLNLCEGTSVTLTAFGGSADNVIKWYNNKGTSPTLISTTTGSSSSITVLDTEGDYYATAENGVCAAAVSDIIEIDYVALPVIQMPDPITLFEGESATISPVYFNTDSVSWSPIDGDLDDVNAENPVVDAQTSGITVYTVEAFNGGNSCSASESIVVTVRKPIKVPNCFTPNDEGTNDTWVIDGLETYEKCVIKVFNRWGTPVHNDTGLYTPWNGKSNGKVMPVGTYYWVIDPGTGEEPMSGTVTIIR